MTWLLVSVRNAEEATAALRGGADWIDLKEPLRGALGAVEAAVAREAVSAIAGRATASAALGELADWEDGVCRPLLHERGIGLVKLGLSACRDSPWQSRWREAQREAADYGKELAAVAYADSDAAQSPSAAEIIHCAAASNCRWMLIDTFDKGAGPLTQHMSPDELEGVLISARAARLCTAVAGSLTPDVVPTLPLELIDMIAVRGAACRGDRNSIVCRHQVAMLRAILPAQDALMATSGHDRQSLPYRLPSREGD
jgi:(5-formylfuran-3-yl)methyl phosphate synthase